MSTADYAVVCKFRLQTFIIRECELVQNKPTDTYEQMQLLIYIHVSLRAEILDFASGQPMGYYAASSGNSFTQGITTTRCVIAQTSAVLIYFAAEP